jgi:alcohol-forming fatty acyl-CoA reductase
LAEELLIHAHNQQTKKIPMIIIRPSIISASLAEPFPGWTDSLGLIGGFYAIAGHGILRDLPLNPKLIGD